MSHVNHQRADEQTRREIPIGFTYITCITYFTISLVLYDADDQLGSLVYWGGRGGERVSVRIHMINICWSQQKGERLERRGGGLGSRGGRLGSSTIFKNLMRPTPRRKWYLTTGRRAH